jgi:hypothetical protein
MLISAPGDIPTDDMQTVADTISRWNFRSGRDMSTPVTVVPILWSQHSYSVFGVRPQEALNEQLVAVADFGFAMFANRLGTPTGVAPSGTAEEIEALHAADKHVSIVRNTDVPMRSGRDAAEERLRLETYLDDLTKDQRGLVYAYTSPDRLAAQLENLLAAQAKKAAAAVPQAGIDEQELERLLSGYRTSPASDSNSGVWPSTEVERVTRTDPRGRTSTWTYWYLVLTNATGGLIRNVRYRYVTPEDEPDESFHFGDQEEKPVTLMPPGGRVRFPIVQAVNGSVESLCIVTWEDDLGEHETPPTTVRTV